MTKPQKLRTVRQQINRGVRDVLTRARTEARDNHASGCVIVLALPGGGCERYVAWENEEQVLGALAQVMHDIAARRS